MQKMQEHVKWAHKKAETFQAKEAKCHQHNYNKRSKAVALEVGDTVLVHVTAFKCHHKIQDQWETREYVVEKWPYSNVPVFVVCPRDGKGHSWTLYRNYLLPISSNIEQNKKDTPVAGVEHKNTSTPVPPVDSEPADTEPSGIVTLSTVGSMSQGSPDQPTSLRCSTQRTWNQLPWRYHNFGLLVDTSPPGIWDAWVGLCICLHVISCLFTVLWESTVWTHFSYSVPCLLSTTHFGIEGNSINVVSIVDFWMGEWTKEYLVWVQLPHQKKIQRFNPHRDLRSVQQPHRENKVTGIVKSENTSPGSQCKVELIPQWFIY